MTACVLSKNGDLAGTKHWQTSYEVWNSQILGGLLSFVLSWTLSYALVHGIHPLVLVSNVQYTIDYTKNRITDIATCISNS